MDRLPHDAPLAALIRADAEAIREWDGRVLPFLFPEFFAVFTYRIAHKLRVSGHSIAARFISSLGHMLTGAELDPGAEVGGGFHLLHTTGTVLGPGVRAGTRLRLWGGVVLGATFWESATNPTGGSPVLGDGVKILTKASVVGPVEIGDRATIGAHALVLDDVPADAIAKGIPARWSRRESEASLESAP